MNPPALRLPSAATIAAAAALLAFATWSSAKDTVKIAFVGPLTGAVSNAGLGARNSAELAVKLRNDDPASKYTYALERLDDECKPNIGVQVATKLAADRSIIGAVPHYCSSVAIATVDVFHRFGLPVVIWAAVMPEITYGHNYGEINRVSATFTGQTKYGAKFMGDLGYKRWVIIHDTLDLGNSLNKYFGQEIRAQGATVLGTFGVAGDQQDFTTELTKVKELKPDAIYVGTLTPLAIRIRTQMDKLGINAQIVGNSGMKSDAYMEALGPLAEGTVIHFDSPPIEKLPGGKQFLDAYGKQGYREPPEAYGPFAFAATNLLIDSIERVGPDRKKVIQNLRETKNHDSVIGKITFDDHGQNITPLTNTYVVQQKKWVLWEQSDYASGKLKLVAPAKP